MKKGILYAGTFVVAGLIAGAAAQAAPVVTLSITASGGTWSVFATDSTGDNAGIADVSIDVKGSNGLTVGTTTKTSLKLPSGFDPVQSSAAGFTVNKSGGTNGVFMTVAQPYIYSGANDPGNDSLVFQGVGQTAGSVPADGAGATWANPVLVASGPYTGTSGTLTADVHTGGFIDVLDAVSGGQWQGPGNIQAATVVPGSVTLGSPVPEPASLGLLGAGVGAALLRRRRA